jgi:hypothetical protein
MSISPQLFGRIADATGSWYHGNMKSIGMLLVILSVVSCGVGCAETRTYEVAVRNDTHQPVTIWLYKEGGPYEDGWKAPEDLAIESPSANEPIGGRIIGPGAIATAGPISGKFDSDASAVLRVYRGAHTFNELLAISRYSGDRINAHLLPGDNEFLITDRNFKLSLDPVAEIPSKGP